MFLLLKSSDIPQKRVHFVVVFWVFGFPEEREFLIVLLPDYLVLPVVRYCPRFYTLVDLDQPTKYPSLDWVPDLWGRSLKLFLRALKAVHLFHEEEGVSWLSFEDRFAVPGVPLQTS